MGLSTRSSPREPVLSLLAAMLPSPRRLGPRFFLTLAATRGVLNVLLMPAQIAHRALVVKGKLTKSALSVDRAARGNFSLPSGSISGTRCAAGNQYAPAPEHSNDRTERVADTFGLKVRKNRNPKHVFQGVDGLQTQVPTMQRESN